MNNYKYIANNNHPWSFFKEITENKAIVLVRMGYTVYFADSNGNHLSPNKQGCWEKVKELYREVVLNRMRPRRNKITFWIPVAWYDRFSGEEVEPFDTVRGLEEYNHAFER